MRRLLPFAGGTAVAAAAGIVITAFAGAGPACAQVAPRIACPQQASPPPTAAPPSARPVARCTVTSLLRSASARPSGRGVRVGFSPRRPSRVTVTVFQSAAGTTVLGERSVFRATSSRGPVRWTGRRQRGRAAPRDGVFFVRVSAAARRSTDVRRFAFRRVRGRFTALRTFARRDGCADLRAFKIERPAFGGRANRAVGVSFRLARPGLVTVELRRGGRTVRRLTRTTRRADVLHRLRIRSEPLRRGRYEVRLRYGATTASLFVERI